MLILNRKPGQSIQIAAGGVGPHTPIGEVFAAGPIEITVSAIANKQVKVGVAAHPGLTILRSELAHRTPTRPASQPEPQPAPAPGSALANTNDTPNANSDATPTPVSNHTRQTLARKLTVLRIMHKLTRQHLAHLSHVPESTIIAMESSDPAHQHHHTPITLTHLDAIAHTLGIPVSYLFIPPNGTPEERIILAMLEVGEE